MNEHRKTNKLKVIFTLIERRFSSMNKGSKLLVKIASYVLLTLLMGAFFLILSETTGMIRFENQGQMIQWLTLYAFRTWALLFCGALILDYLRGGEKEEK